MNLVLHGGTRPGREARHFGADRRDDLGLFRRRNLEVGYDRDVGKSGAHEARKGRAADRRGDEREAARLEQKRFARLADLFDDRSEEHTSELQSLMRNSYAGFCYT